MTINRFKYIIKHMKKNLRQDERFVEIGRVDAPEICALPGVMDDISLNGCRVHFPVPVTLDEDSEYTLKIKLSHLNAPAQLELICSPQWELVNCQETQIGFSILRSHDTPDLSAYIRQRKLEAQEQDLVPEDYDHYPNISFA